jgi:glycosyltransferase involved in cell wall biosynthesis
MKKISIITGCYNEEDNVIQLTEAICKIMKEELPQYDYEHVFIDNCSEDSTLSLLRDVCSKDRHVKVIENSRNFGHVRSPFHGMLQTTGDCTISMAADFQDPPDLIPTFVKKWEEGYKVVCAVKTSSKESHAMFGIRKFYYNLVKKMSEVDSIDNFTGFGLYDKQVIAALRLMEDPYPYFRGLICEIGFKRAIVEFNQPKRERGKTHNNFYTLFDMAMLGITSNSKVPLRLATIGGFIFSVIALIGALVYLILKLVFWYNMPMGMAPLIIGVFLFSSIQLFFIGLLGEYIAQILTKVTDRPLVIESERINFDSGADTAASAGADAEDIKNESPARFDINENKESPHGK